MFWDFWITFMAFLVVFIIFTLLVTLAEDKSRCEKGITLTWNILRMALAFIGLDRVLFWLAGGQ